MPQRVDATAYYDFFPSTSHGPGDIWSALPSFGILSDPFVTGIVVTPACDLSNRKVETITFLPVLPLKRFLASASYLPELKRAIAGQLQTAGLGKTLELGEGFSAAEDTDLRAGLQLLEEHVANSSTGKREIAAAERAASGIRFMRESFTNDVGGPLLKYLEELLQVKDFDQTLRRLMTNGRPDTHFLPYDQQQADWSGISEHSVALFRYPLSIPLAILDEAQSVADEQWANSTQRLRRSVPCVSSFQQRPMKRLRMQPRFLTDLLTRFAAVFGRIGSPDFTEDTIIRFTAELRNS